MLNYLRLIVVGGLDEKTDIKHVDLFSNRAPYSKNDCNRGALAAKTDVKHDDVFSNKVVIARMIVTGGGGFAEKTDV